MALDLSSLEERLEPEKTIENSGSPLNILLSDIDEDPNQPRSEFSSEAMIDMVASIKATGVKTPVSIREHPTEKGRWMLNYGARRYRASLEAGKEAIPAFIDDSHDHYDQVIENIQRDDLKPMEFAVFIKARVDAGDSLSFIAKSLGKNKSTITHHMSLIDAPKCIDAVYKEGKSTSPRTLYDLRSLHDNYPEEVEEWCHSEDYITGKKVTELAGELKDGTYGQDLESETTTLLEEELVDNASESESESELEATEEKTDKIKKPLLLLTIDGLEVEAILNRLPSQTGLIFIRYKDGTIDEVSVERCFITALVTA